MGKLHTIGNIQLRVYAGDHHPPHFHVCHPDYEVQMELASLRIIRGTLPARDRRLVLDWAVANIELLRATWDQLNPSVPI